MNKKLIAIIAVAAAILIIAVVAIVSVGNKVEPAGKDMDVKAGVEDNIFDGESANDENTTDSSDASKDDAASNDSDSSTSDNNDNTSKDTSKDNDSKNDQGSSSKPSGLTEYEKFHAMSPAKQQEYMESFGDVDKFFRWYNKAKKEYEKAHPDIEIDGGPVELE